MTCLQSTARAFDLKDRVLFPGRLTDRQLGELFAWARAVVYPSLYEGFGLPVLEAQELGIPVACSRAGSLPEVAGESACFFDPLRADEMAAAISRCLTDGALRKELVAKGKANAQRFTWADTAARTLAVYRKVLAPSAPSGLGLD
jgi:glycosyltransferase involved in cell wall biosynthesis